MYIYIIYTHIVYGVAIVQTYHTLYHYSQREHGYFEKLIIQDFTVDSILSTVHNSFTSFLYVVGYVT